MANLYAIVIHISEDEHVIAGIFADETSALAHCAAGNVEMEPAARPKLDFLDMATVLHECKAAVHENVLTGEELLDPDSEDDDAVLVPENKEHALLSHFYSTRGDNDAMVYIVQVPLGLWGTHFNND